MFDQFPSKLTGKSRSSVRIIHGGGLCGSSSGIFNVGYSDNLHGKSTIFSIDIWHTNSKTNPQHAFLISCLVLIELWVNTISLYSESTQNDIFNCDIISYIPSGCWIIFVRIFPMQTTLSGRHFGISNAVWVKKDEKIANTGLLI